MGIDPGTNILGFGIVRVDAAGKPAFVDMGVVDLRKIASPYDKLEVIHEKVGALCDLHHPDDLAIESPFYAKNAQVPFKLGRAQGAAIAAGVGTGIWKSFAEAARAVRTGPDVPPDLQMKALYEKHAPVFSALYGQMKDAMHASAAFTAKEVRS